MSLMGFNSCFFSVLYQGLDDEFYPNQLLPENFVEACRSKNVPVTLRMQEVLLILYSSL